MRIKKGSLSYWLLTSLEELTKDGVLETFSYSAQMKYILNLPHLSPTIRRSSLSEAIRRLREDGLIEKEKNDDGNVFMRLTALGKEELGVEEQWDGKYRIVIWDIPENKRRLRDLLRRKLKEFKFKNLQKSVWVSKRNVTDKLRKLIEELEMGNWVVILESDDPWLSRIDFHARLDSS